jgi:hypothetical protein
MCLCIINSKIVVYGLRIKIIEMKFVEIYKLQNDGSQQIIARCDLVDGVVILSGEDAKLKSYLEEEGINYYSSGDRKKLFPKDGQAFLEQLKYNFKSGYLNASDILEE